MDANVNYMVENTNNRPGLGDSPNNVGYSLSGLAPNIDQAWLQNAQNPATGDMYQWNNNVYSLNPYWIVNQNHNASKKTVLWGMLQEHTK